MGKTRSTRVDIHGLNQKSFGGRGPNLKIDRFYPSLLEGYLSSNNWLLFCDRVDEEMLPLVEKGNMVLCPLLCLPVVGCFLIGRHLEENEIRRRNLIVEALEGICQMAMRQASNAGVRFYVREGAVNVKGVVAPGDDDIFIEIMVLGLLGAP